MADEKSSPKFQANASMGFADTLKQLSSKKMSAYILLKNGRSYGGRIGAVSSRNVIVEKLQEKDFYDAIVKIDEIAAIEVRVRGE